MWPYVKLLWSLVLISHKYKVPISNKLHQYLPYSRTWCGLSANWGCTSETRCTRLAEYTGRKKIIKNLLSGQPLRKFVGLYLPKKKLVKQQYLLHTFSQYGELGPLTAEIHSGVWGTSANFNAFRVLAALLQWQTLRHWTEGATYVLQGGHHILVVRFLSVLAKN